MLEPGSFGGWDSALLPFSTLVATGITTYLVRCGDDLSLALAPNGTGTRHLWERQRAGAR